MIIQLFFFCKLNLSSGYFSLRLIRKLYCSLIITVVFPVVLYQVFLYFFIPQSICIYVLLVVVIISFPFFQHCFLSLLSYLLKYLKEKHFEAFWLTEWKTQWKHKWMKITLIPTIQRIRRYLNKVDLTFIWFDIFFQI